MGGVAGECIRLGTSSCASEGLSHRRRRVGPNGNGGGVERLCQEWLCHFSCPGTSGLMVGDPVFSRGKCGDILYFCEFVLIHCHAGGHGLAVWRDRVRLLYHCCGHGVRLHDARSRQYGSPGRRPSRHPGPHWAAHVCCGRNHGSCRHFSSTLHCSPLLALRRFRHSDCRVGASACPCGASCAFALQWRGVPLARRSESPSCTHPVYSSWCTMQARGLRTTSGNQPARTAYRLAHVQHSEIRTMLSC
mmetsp:Transcript_28364/g.49689  ORF Transcript_28364/g.49689 Transcript_28364/m.49689 type:complete len:247 (+) Transcript_28364:455-1195(+)